MAGNSTIRKKANLLLPPQWVIFGWIEGLQLMSVGSNYRFFIPYQLAYGDRAFDGTVIALYSALILDIEMIKIKSPKINN